MESIKVLTFIIIPVIKKAFPTGRVDNGARFSQGAASSRLLQCSFCTFLTAMKDLLRIHISTHTSERPFSCSLCDYCASIKNAVKEHTRVHTRAKPYACPFCPDRGPYSYSSLQNHLLKHNNQMSFNHRLRQIPLSIFLIVCIFLLRQILYLPFTHAAVTKS